MYIILQDAVYTLNRRPLYGAVFPHRKNTRDQVLISGNKSGPGYHHSSWPTEDFLLLDPKLWGLAILVHKEVTLFLKNTAMIFRTERYHHCRKVWTSSFPGTAGEKRITISERVIGPDQQKEVALVLQMETKGNIKHKLSAWMLPGFPLPVYNGKWTCTVTWPKKAVWWPGGAGIGVVPPGKPQRLASLIDEGERKSECSRN